MKTIKIYALLMLMSAMFTGSASAVIIFEDDFSGGSRNTVGNGWSEIEEHSNDVAVDNHGRLRLRDSQHGIDAAASQLNGFSTIGLTDIMLSYEWGASYNTESNDSLFVEWRVSGTSSWTQLVEHALGGSSLVGNVLNLGVLAANQAGIEFRFYTSVSTSSERAYLDNVILSGRSIVSEPGTLSLMALTLVILGARRKFQKS